MPLYAVKYAICTFLQNMRNMLQSHNRYKRVSLPSISPPSSLQLFGSFFMMLVIVDFVRHYCENVRLWWIGNYKCNYNYNL